MRPGRQVPGENPGDVQATVCSGPNDTDAYRAQNLAIVEAFFTLDSAGSERQGLWSSDGVFELPAAEGGPLVLYGLAEINSRALKASTEISKFRYLEVAIHPGLDPELFFVTCRGVGRSVRSGRLVARDLMNMLRVRHDGIVHRVEYSGPALPWADD